MASPRCSSPTSVTSVHAGHHDSHPSASSTSRPILPATTGAPLSIAGQPKRLSELRPGLSGKAYYIDRRPSAQYDAQLALPQSALLRAPKASPLASSAYLIHDARRPSHAHSLPPFKPGSSSTCPVPRQIRSENASLAGRHYNLYGRPHSDKILGYRSSQDEDERDQYQRPRGRPPPASSPSQVLSTYSLSDGGLENDDATDATPTGGQTLRSLLHLALGATPLSFAIFFYTIAIIVYTICISPLRLCLKSRLSFSSQLTCLLVGPLNTQRRCIHVEPVNPASSRSSSSSHTPLSSSDAIEAQNQIILDYSSIQPGKLIFIHLLAPIIALPLALCAWAMAVAWGLGVIVSDERAGDDRDERRLAQRLVDYWGSWLNWGIEYQPRSNPSSERRGRRQSNPEMGMAGAITS